jgi:predicted TIM-barrel fold metal-dependent hydrolase
MLLGVAGGHGIVDDIARADLADRIADAYDRPGVVGLRIVASAQFNPEELARLRAGGYDRALAACERLGVPVFVMIAGTPQHLAPVAKRFPDLQIILDHIGLPRPPAEQPDTPPWKMLPEVLRLAEYPNVAIKLSGAPSLSAEPYPFADVWPHVVRLLESFGVERLAWASDIGVVRGRVGWSTYRVPAGEGEYVGKHTYMESLAFLLYNDQLSTGEKEQLLGQSARRILKWPRSPQPIE